MVFLTRQKHCSGGPAPRPGWWLALPFAILLPALLSCPPRPPQRPAAGLGEPPLPSWPASQTASPMPLVPLVHACPLSSHAACETRPVRGSTENGTSTRVPCALCHFNALYPPCPPRRRCLYWPISQRRKMRLQESREVARVTAPYCGR